MFGRREEIRKWLFEIVERFRQKGAVSADRAMTAEELGLPPRFQEAMNRRLGRLGIFVEVNGKYYLNEERLKEIEEQRRLGGGAVSGSRNRMFMLRIVRMFVGVVFVALFLVSVLVQSWELRVTAAFFAGAWIVITVLQMYYMSRIRRGSGGL
jgi:hypothetical protein